MYYSRQAVKCFPPTKIDFLVKCLMQQVSGYSLVPDHWIGVTVRVGKKRERGWGTLDTGG